MKNNKTAVEWLESELDWLTNYMMEEHKEQLFNQAKEMEKEQIKDAWLSGQDDGATICTPNQHYPDEDYYNETYKQQDNNE